MIKQLEYAESMLRSNPMKAYEIAMEVKDSLKHTDDYVEALNIEMSSLWLMSRFEEAFKVADEVHEISEKLDSDLWRSRTYSLRGNVYFDLGNWDKSLENYMKGLASARKISNKLREAILLNNIGEIYSALDALDEAKKYYSMSLDITKDMVDENVIGIAQLNMADVYFKQGKIEDALSMINVAINFFAKIEDYISIAYAHLALAKIYKSKNDREKAKQDLKLAIDIMRRLHERFNLLQAYEIMIDILIEENHFEEALEYVEDAMDISEDLGVKKDIAEVALFAADIYEKTKNYSKSLEYYKHYSEVRLKHEKEKETEIQKNITAQINIEKAIHEKEIYRLKNVELRKKTDEIQKLYDDMQIINNIGRDITSTMDIKEILYLLYDNINKLMDASYFGIFRYDPDERSIYADLMLEYGQLCELKNIPYDHKSSVGAWSIRNRLSIFTNNYEKDYKKYKEDYDSNMSTTHRTKSLIVVPLIIQDDIIGAITVQSTLRDAYKDYHFNLIEALASFIAIAIRNSQKSRSLSIEIEERINTQNKLEILNEKLSHMSYYDALTEIPNRRSFLEYFSRELKRSRRNKEQIGLLIIDVDHFKEYNDNYGHVEGDYCLTNVASLLQKALKREIDFVARYGGDEFVAVLINATYDGTYQVAEQMKFHVNEAAIEHRFSPIKDIITLTIGGVVLVPDKDDSMELIIQEADKALYKAKEKGRNQICFYNDMN